MINYKTDPTDTEDYKSQLTQFEFDLNQKMRLVGIDSIFIP